jgi:hypothetical protein
LGLKKKIEPAEQKEEALYSTVENFKDHAMPESEVSKNCSLADTPKFLSGIEDDSRDESRIE